MANVKMLIFGGCNVRAPLTGPLFPSWRRVPGVDWSGVPSGYRIIGTPFFTYTLNEMLQAVACYRGEQSIPADLYFLCNMKEHTAPTPATSPLARTDVALVEPNTSHEILLDGIYINRRPVLQLLGRVTKISRETKSLGSRWFEKGLVAMNDEVRRATAAELIPMIPETLPHYALTRAVLERAVGEKPSQREGLERLTAALDFPIGVVTFTWAYMPDGRALSWPADFNREITSAASDLNIPVYEPRHLVSQAGVANSLEKDLRHYTNTFMPVVAKPIVEFAFEIATSAQPRKRAVG